MMIRSENNAKHPVTFTPMKQYSDEEFVPISYTIYKGILPGYVVSNYGTVFNIYTREYIKWFLYNNEYPRVELLFYRYNTVTPVSLAVDRLVLQCIDYDNQYESNEYRIAHLDRDPLNCHIDNLRLYTPKEYHRWTKRKPKNHNITYQELRIH